MAEEEWMPHVEDAAAVDLGVSNERRTSYRDMFNCIPINNCTGRGKCTSQPISIMRMRLPAEVIASIGAEKYNRGRGRARQLRALSERSKQMLGEAGHGGYISPSIDLPRPGFIFDQQQNGAFEAGIACSTINNTNNCNTHQSDVPYELATAQERLNRYPVPKRLPAGKANCLDIYCQEDFPRLGTNAANIESPDTKAPQEPQNEMDITAEVTKWLLHQEPQVHQDMTPEVTTVQDAAPNADRNAVQDAVQNAILDDVQDDVQDAADSDECQELQVQKEAASEADTVQESAGKDSPKENNLLDSTTEVNTRFLMSLSKGLTALGAYDCPSSSSNSSMASPDRDSRTSSLNSTLNPNAGVFTPKPPSSPLCYVPQLASAQPVSSSQLSASRYYAPVNPSDGPSPNQALLDAEAESLWNDILSDDKSTQEHVTKSDEELTEKVEHCNLSDLSSEASTFVMVKRNLFEDQRHVSDDENLDCAVRFEGLPRRTTKTNLEEVVQPFGQISRIQLEMTIKGGDETLSAVVRMVDSSCAALLADCLDGADTSVFTSDSSYSSPLKCYVMSGM